MAQPHGRDHDDGPAWTNANNYDLREPFATMGVVRVASVFGCVGTFSVLALVVLIPPGHTESRRSEAGASSRSIVEVTRSARVYSEPGASRATRRGKVNKRARFRVHERVAGEGCKDDWLRIGTRAWICAAVTRPTTRTPSRGSGFRSRPGVLLPRPYLVTFDAPAYDSLDAAVQAKDPTTIGGVGGFVERRKARRDGKRFFKTPRGWIAADDVEQVEPIGFRGVTLDANDRGKRLAFVVASKARLHDARGRRLDAPGLERQHYLGELGEPVRRRGHVFHDIGDGRFIRADDIGVIEWRDPPDEVRKNERWLDVSLGQQTLVAFEGTRPVLATLVSTGRTSTPAGIYRIKKKRAIGRLRSLPGSSRQWDVHVPWVMTLEGRIAMHVAYWHRKFGRAYSAGCINLSPTDAKWIWDFTRPVLPAGWARVRSDSRNPGTIVWVHQ